MTPQHALALVLLPLLTVAAAAAASWSRHVRDILFFAMASLAVLVERLDVNFFSAAWYRGTTRGIQFSLVEILAFGLLIGCWFGPRDGERRRFWPGSLGLMLIFLAYAGISVVAFEPRLYGAFELSRMLAALVIFLATAAYVRSKREWTLLLVALGGAVGFESFWGLKQHFITHLGRATGSFSHANSLSMYYCLAVPPLAACACAGWSRSLRWFCAFAAALGTVGLLMTLSRAGIPIFTVVVLGTILACVSWRLRPGLIAFRTILAVGTIAVVAAFWTQIEERYAESSLRDEYFDPAVDGRGVYLRLSGMIVRDHFFGVGLNNWSYQVSRDYGLRLGYRFTNYDYLVSVYGTKDEMLFGDAYLAAPAHNLAALTLGELGVPGLVIFTLVWLRWFWMGAVFLPMPRDLPLRTMGVGIFFGICGIFGQSLTEWVYRQAPILFTFHILLGALASLAFTRRRAQIEKRAIAAEPVATPIEAPDENLVAEEV